MSVTCAIRSTSPRRRASTRFTLLTKSTCFRRRLSMRFSRRLKSRLHMPSLSLPQLKSTKSLRRFCRVASATSSDVCPCEIVTNLKKIVKSEKIQADEDALIQIARQSAGGMRDAISLLDQLSSTGDRITLALAQTCLVRRRVKPCWKSFHRSTIMIPLMGWSPFTRRSMQAQIHAHWRGRSLNICVG